MRLIDVYNFKWKHSGRCEKHVLETRSQSSLAILQFTGESFTVEFVVIKHFSGESLHVEPSCGLDIVVYMLKCMFC